MEYNFYTVSISNQSHIVSENLNLNSIDLGYESILNGSSSSYLNEHNSISLNFNNSNRLNDYNHHVTSTSIALSSQPSSPIKSKSFANTTNNSSTTPDFKKQFVADVNGLYFASVRNNNNNNSFNSNNSEFASSVSSSVTAFSSCSSSWIPSPIHNQHSYNHFSSSSSNSPINSIKSPHKFILNTDDYINSRDNLKCKLLRSPAFKFDNSLTKSPSFAGNNNNRNLDHSCSSLCSPFDAHCQEFREIPKIKSFAARLQSNLPNFKSSVTVAEEKREPEVKSVKATPTEQEFIELLFKNHHIPGNPEFLIGRRMGIEKVDVLGELNKRSMMNVIDKIMSYLEPIDYVRVACVNREWRQIIKQDEKRNKDRLKMIKFRRKFYVTTKENRDSLVRFNQFIKTDTNASKPATSKTSKHAKDNLESETRFAITLSSLDINCLNNRVNNQNVQCFLTKSPKSLVKLSPVKVSLAMKLESDKPTSPIHSKTNNKQKIDLICSKKSKKNLKRL